MKPFAVEPGRLDRAMQLAWWRLGPGQYAVQGGHGVYYVDLSSDQPCTCADQEHRGGSVEFCKHRLCAMAADGDQRILQAMGDRLLARQRTAEPEDEDETTRFPHGEP